MGASGYWADPSNGFKRYAAGGDVTFMFFGRGVTAEGLAGQIEAGRFTAQILTAHVFLLSLGDDGKWALEPVLGGEGLQLRGPVSGSGKAAVLGLNVHYTDRVKLMLQGERGLFPGDKGLQNRFAVQLGGAVLGWRESRWAAGGPFGWRVHLQKVR